MHARIKSASGGGEHLLGILHVGDDVLEFFRKPVEAADQSRDLVVPLERDALCQIRVSFRDSVDGVLDDDYRLDDCMGDDERDCHANQDSEQRKRQDEHHAPFHFNKKLFCRTDSDENPTCFRRDDSGGKVRSVSDILQKENLIAGNLALIV